MLEIKKTIAGRMSEEARKQCVKKLKQKKVESGDGPVNTVEKGKPRVDDTKAERRNQKEYTTTT